MIVNVSFCGCVVVRSFGERVRMCVAALRCVVESRKSEYSECLKQPTVSLDESVWECVLKFVPRYVICDMFFHVS